MVIVVECESCHSRFRVKKTLLDGASAIRFRCRTCGGNILVRNPETRKTAALPSPTPPPSSESQMLPAAPATDPEPELPPAATNMPAPPAPPPEPEMPAFASRPAVPVPVGPDAVRMEELVPYSSEEKVRVERDSIRGTDAVPPAARASRATPFIRRAGAVWIRSIFAGVGIFLLASGAYYFRGSDPGGKSPGSSSAATALSKPAYEVQNLKSYTPREAIAGNLFVITGTVKNVGKAPSRGIRVQATLIGENRQVLAKQASIAGNYIDNRTLPHMKRTAIEAHLAARRYDEGSWIHDIPPGKVLPFIVVYFEPPGKVERIEVLAIDAEL